MRKDNKREKTSNKELKGKIEEKKQRERKMKQDIKQGAKLHKELKVKIEKKKQCESFQKTVGRPIEKGKGWTTRKNREWQEVQSIPRIRWGSSEK